MGGHFFAVKPKQKRKWDIERNGTNKLFFRNIIDLPVLYYYKDFK
jgi:hypothetical protein